MQCNQSSLLTHLTMRLAWPLKYRHNRNERAAIGRELQRLVIC